jgi:1-acyl-sn-glycerol-3-phosphate acyltransferase
MPVFFVGALAVFLVTLPFDRNGRILHSYTCFWGGHYVLINPMWRFDLRGRKNIEPGKAYVYCANHQSSGDIPVLFATMLEFKFVSKHSNFKAPFLGWNMSLNRYIRLVRGDAASGAKMLAECKAWLERGVSVMMFPEGTRSKTGYMLPFKQGAFVLAKEAGVPVVPIVIDGSFEAVPPDWVLRQKGVVDVRVRIGAPIDPASFPDARAFSDAVRDAMQAVQKDLWRMRGHAPTEAAEGKPARKPAGDVGSDGATPQVSA